MTSARDILDERLAKGEISIEEHEKLAERIRASEAPSAKPSKSAPITISTYLWISIAGGTISAISARIWYQSVVDNSGGWVPQPDTGQALLMLILAFLTGTAIVFAVVFMFSKLRGQ
ncbi:MAG: hypothetical protein AB7E70_07630 [Hyphomicrobiaceae bacterium]